MARTGWFGGSGWPASLDAGADIKSVRARMPVAAVTLHRYRTVVYMGIAPTVVATTKLCGVVGFCFVFFLGGGGERAWVSPAGRHGM